MLRISKKQLSLLSICLLIVAAVLFVASVNKIQFDCQEKYRQDKVISTGSKDIKIEIADSGDEQERGLSGRDCIGDSQAMLFEFDAPGYYNFWMKDMKFPIDIIWIDEKMRVIEVTDSIQPSTYPDTFTSNLPPMYVLEVQAGNAAKLGLTAGSKLSF